MPKPAPSLGFDLDDLDGAVSGYEKPKKKPKAVPAPEQASAPVGRPRTLAHDARPLSIRLDGEQRQWLLEEAARRTLESGERHDVSRVIRELIDQARGEGG